MALRLRRAPCACPPHFRTAADVRYCGRCSSALDRAPVTRRPDRGEHCTIAVVTATKWSTDDCLGHPAKHTKVYE